MGGKLGLFTLWPSQEHPREALGLQKQSLDSLGEKVKDFSLPRKSLGFSFFSLAFSLMSLLSIRSFTCLFFHAPIFNPSNYPSTHPPDYLSTHVPSHPSFCLSNSKMALEVLACPLEGPKQWASPVASS